MKYDFYLDGIKTIARMPKVEHTTLHLLMSVDDTEKTLSIDDGSTQFTVPLKPILHRLEGE